MKNKLKIISIIALVLAIMISFTSSCFASSIEGSSVTYNEEGGVDFVFNGTTYNCDFSSSAYSNDKVFRNYYFYYNEKAGVGYLVFVDADLLFVTDTGNYSIKYTNCDLVKNQYVGISFFVTEKEGIVTSSLMFSDSGSGIDSVDQIVFSSCDILNSDGEVVFQKTPVGVQSTLVPIVQQAPLEETTKEIVGILPIVLIILVGLIGLRKGLALLSQTLHKA